MAGLTLVIGTKNYSSWSLRPWLLLKHLGIQFRERLIHLDTEEFAREVPRLSPSHRVPVLIQGDIVIWESLAICEYASELAGGRGWPGGAAARAEARAVAAEMHAGFQALRTACPMNIRAHDRRVPMTGGLARDIRRVNAIWEGCRRRHRQDGPWLFGSYSAADAMYAPVALRFRTYGLDATGEAAEYRDTVLADPHLGRWAEDARSEDIIVAADEAGDPA